MTKLNLTGVLKVSVMFLACVGSYSQATEHAYACETTLEYKVVNSEGQLEVRSVAMFVNGERNLSGGISGRATASAGLRNSSYNLARARVDEESVEVAGALSNGEGFSLRYDVEGTANRASYTVLNNGRDFIATNEIISTAESGDYYPVYCEID